jgi:hypothetical protein
VIALFPSYRALARFVLLFLLFYLLVFALAFAADSYAAPPVNSPQSYADALCMGLSHEYSDSGAFQLRDWQCKPGPEVGKVREYWVFYTQTYEHRTQRLAQLVYPDGETVNGIVYKVTK